MYFLMMFLVSIFGLFKQPARFHAVGKSQRPRTIIMGGCRGAGRQIFVFESGVQPPPPSLDVSPDAVFVRALLIKPGDIPGHPRNRASGRWQKGFGLVT